MTDLRPNDVAEQKRELDSLGGAEFFAYDRHCRVGELEGLEKLRAVKDRALAANLYELFFSAQLQAIKDPHRAAREAKLRERKELEALASMAERAMRGEFGARAKKEALEVMRDQTGQLRTDTLSLRECLKRVQKARGV